MSFEDPTVEELRLLAVLIRVYTQYMRGNYTSVEHDFMSAGEPAIHLLAKYGMVVHEGLRAAWTTKAKVLEELDYPKELSNFDEIRSELRKLREGSYRRFRRTPVRTSVMSSWTS
jgi:hypothetical protein